VEALLLRAGAPCARCASTQPTTGATTTTTTTATTATTPALRAQVKSICLSNDEMVNGYKELFEGPSSSELQAQFNQIVGDSFDAIDPSMQALFDGANQNVNTAAQDICSDLGKGSLSLDQAILACLFHHIENFCPKADADEDLPTFLKTLRWKLDDVVFDWGAAPPPPPPVIHGPYEDLLASDPEGMEIAREKLMEFWPQLSCARAASNQHARSTPNPHDPLLAGTLRSRPRAPTWAATARPTGLDTGPCTT
jgi:hypothetical protein